MKASKPRAKTNNRLKDGNNIDFWKNHIDSQSVNNLSRKEYCKNNGLIYHRFCYWHRKLESSSKISPLIPVKIKSDNELSTILGSIKLSNGSILNIHNLEAMAAILRGLVK